MSAILPTTAWTSRTTPNYSYSTQEKLFSYVWSHPYKALVWGLKKASPFLLKLSFCVKYDYLSQHLNWIMTTITIMIWVELWLLKSRFWLPAASPCRITSLSNTSWATMAKGLLIIKFSNNHWVKSGWMKCFMHTLLLPLNLLVPKFTIKLPEQQLLLEGRYESFISFVV